MKPLLLSVLSVIVLASCAQLDELADMAQQNQTPSMRPANTNYTASRTKKPIKPGTGKPVSEETRRRLAEQQARKNDPVVKEITRTLEQILATDSKSWTLNRFQPGTVRNVRTEPVSQDPDAQYLVGDYDYRSIRGIRKGWIRAKFSNDTLECVSLHDDPVCRKLGNSVSLRFAQHAQRSGLSEEEYEAVRSEWATISKLPRDRWKPSYRSCMDDFAEEQLSDLSDSLRAECRASYVLSQFKSASEHNRQCNEKYPSYVQSSRIEGYRHNWKSHQQCRTAFYNN